MGDRHVIGSFQPFAELAQGPTTTVYKAYEPAAQRFVLLKVLRPALARDAAAVRRFTTEADLAARIDHPNVVHIYDFGQVDGTVYLAAEFVDGLDLAALIAEGPLPYELAAWIAREVARGLAAAHAQGILHRDLKPSNVLLAHDGRVKLTDFGMASLVEVDEGRGEVRGTMPYLAPEQVLGEPPSPASDLFALGATLYELLVGQAAFRGADEAALLDAIVNHDPVPRLAADPLVPATLTALVGRLLAKEPGARPVSADAVADALGHVVDGLGRGASDLAMYLEHPSAYERMPATAVAAPSADAVDTAEPDPAPAAERPARTPARRGSGRRWAGAVLVLAVVLVGAVWWQVREDPAPSDPESPSQAEPEPLVPAPSAATAEAPARGSSDAVDESIPRSEEEGQPEPGPMAEELPVEIEADQTAGDTTEAVLDPAVRGATEPAQGQVHVAATPWAAVYIGDDSVGVTATTLDLPVGTYDLVLRHPQFPPYTRTVAVRPGSAADVNVSLWSTVGQLTLEVQPWAEVYIDDEYRDTVPPQDRPLILAPGRHTLRLVHPTLGSWETTIVAEAGVAETRRFDLTTLLVQR